ncbi:MULTISPECIES: hypothetical protein [Pseudomonas]|uniref:Uncharacterized protein n=1 Tax=Pseudomonas idahonensis TaxID=2942628 RepID=A0ABT5PZU8_9PSED|nr:MULTISPECIES: hypothetical protein [Pseudomonas]MDD1147436.1 hypothetical protein [Pseudomonas idahonensis]
MRIALEQALLIGPWQIGDPVFEIVVMHAALDWDSATWGHYRGPGDNRLIKT